MGTPAYLPPQQAEGRLDQIDQRTDTYGLGAMLYSILTRRPPFVGSNTLDVLKQATAGKPHAAPGSLYQSTCGSRRSLASRCGEGARGAATLRRLNWPRRSNAPPARHPAPARRKRRPSHVDGDPSVESQRGHEPRPVSAADADGGRGSTPWPSALTAAPPPTLDATRRTQRILLRPGYRPPPLSTRDLPSASHQG